jgi:hypothetical protein
MKSPRFVLVVLIGLLGIGAMGVVASRAFASPLTHSAQQVATAVAPASGTDPDNIEEQVGDQNGPEDKTGIDESNISAPTDSAVEPQLPVQSTIPDSAQSVSSNDASDADNIDEQVGDQSGPDQNGQTDQGGSDSSQ